MFIIKRFLIYIFLALSSFFIISAFVTKSQGKEPITINYVLSQLKDAKIGFEIQADIQELRDALNDLNNNTTNGGSDILGNVIAIGKNIYYFARFAIKMVVHTIIATLNVIICVLKCIGFTDMNYLSLSGGGMTGASGVNPENLVVLRP